MGTIQQQDQFSDFDKKKKDFIYKFATLRFDQMGPSSEIFLALLRNFEEQLSEKNHFRNLSKEKRKNEHVLKFVQFRFLVRLKMQSILKGKKFRRFFIVDLLYGHLSLGLRCQVHHHHL